MLMHQQQKLLVCPSQLSSPWMLIQQLQALLYLIGFLVHFHLNLN